MSRTHLGKESPNKTCLLSDIEARFELTSPYSIRAVCIELLYTLCKTLLTPSSFCYTPSFLSHQVRWTFNIIVIMSNHQQNVFLPYAGEDGTEPSLIVDNYNDDFHSTLSLYSARTVQQNHQKIHATLDSLV